MPDYFIYFINLTLCRSQFSLSSDTFTCTFSTGPTQPIEHEQRSFHHILVVAVILLKIELKTSRHQIKNTGTNNISKGVPCFTDIRCHTLVWNLGYLVFSQPSYQLLPKPIIICTQWNHFLKVSQALQSFSVCRMTISASSCLWVASVWSEKVVDWCFHLTSSRTFLWCQTLKRSVSTQFSRYEDSLRATLPQGWLCQYVENVQAWNHWAWT